MKKFLHTFTIFFSLFLFYALQSPFYTKLFVKAEEKQDAPSYGEYACVLKDAYFYTSPDERMGIFLLPKTYYVKLLDYTPDFCRVEYLYDSASTKKLIGYAKTDCLNFVDYVPKRPYLYYLFDVNYVLDNDQANDSSFLTQITLSCAYYGDFKIGAKTYCYVLRGDTFGYVPKPETLSFEENPEYADNLISADVPTPTEKEEKKSSSVQIALLVALCLLIPVLASMIVKPPRRPPYEQDE